DAEYSAAGGRHLGGHGAAYRRPHRRPRAPLDAGVSRRIRRMMQSIRRELGVLPPPLWGRAGEGGWCVWQHWCTNLATPTPNPSPQGGGEYIEYAATARDLRPFTHVFDAHDDSCVMRSHP